MLIKENEEIRKQEIGSLKQRIEELLDNENKLKNNLQSLETEISDKNKVGKILLEII